MSNNKYLETVTKDLIPDVFGSIKWENIWTRKLEDGVGFQFMVLCSILSVAKQQGLSVEIPLLQSEANDYFLLRNELPLSHRAQAGNSATALHRKPLKDRFFFSLIPKFIIKKDGRYYSFFVEGCPYHKIATGKEYSLRPDIIVFEGKPASDFPRFNENETEVSFSYVAQSHSVEGILRVISSPFIPCAYRFPSRDIDFPPTSIVECSVNKSKDIAEQQLNSYIQLFSNDHNQPVLHLVTGNKLMVDRYNAMSIDINNTTTINDCTSAGQIILSSILG